MHIHEIPATPVNLYAAEFMQYAFHFADHSPLTNQPKVSQSPNHVFLLQHIIKPACLPARKCSDEFQ